MLVARLLPRIAALKLPDLHSYRALLERAPQAHAEWQIFINLLTTNKTEFYREPTHFDWIIQTFLPSWQSHQPNPTVFRAWSAACSTGQEPYTLAFALEDYRSRNAGFEYQILATDIDTEVLKTAANGVFPLCSINEIPASLRTRFTNQGKGALKGWFRINEALHQKLTFKHFNLVGSAFPPADSFDLILCRNVFIYFTPETIGEICQYLAQSARKDAVLITGHSESVTTATENADIGWESVQPSILRRK